METRITEMDFNGDLKSIVNQVLIMMAADGVQTVFFRISEHEEPYIKMNITTYQNYSIYDLLNPGLLVNGETEIKSAKAAFSRVLSYAKLKQSFPFIMVTIRKDTIQLLGQELGKTSWEVEVRFSPIDFPWIIDGNGDNYAKLENVTDQTIYVWSIDYSEEDLIG